LYGFLFLAALWASSIILRRRRLWILLVAVCTLATCGFAFLLASGHASLWLPASVALYERNGIMFSHMVLISNTVLASFLWLGLLLSSSRHAPVRRETELVGWLWIIVLAAWLLTPFLGVFLQTDHFIIIVAMLAWLNMALYLAPETMSGILPAQRFKRSVPLVIAVFSTLFLSYVLIKGILQIGKFETFTIHLSIWLALAWSAWFQWFRARGAAIGPLWRKGRWSLALISLCFGAVGLAVVVHRGMKEIPNLEQRIPVVAWIQEHVPLDEAVCSDPENASIYGAHIARQVYPEEANMVSKETDDVLRRRLITIGVAYDASAAGDVGRYSYLINGLRTSTCVQFAKAARLLERLGVSHASIDAFSGCLQGRADQYEQEVMSAIMSGRVDEDVFRSTCPWVIIPDDRAAFWRLPASYREMRINGETSVWHADQPSMSAL